MAQDYALYCDKCKKYVYSLSGLFHRWQPVATMLFVQDHYLGCDGSLNITDEHDLYGYESVYSRADDGETYEINRKNSIKITLGEK